MIKGSRNNIHRNHEAHDWHDILLSYAPRALVLNNSLPMKPYKSGGGWPAVWYTWRKAREAGGILKLWKAMRSKNACKTCALGMGGQRGGMVNELGHFPEVCKKSLQAMVADMQGAIRSDFWQKYLSYATCSSFRRASWKPAADLSNRSSTLARRAATHRSLGRMPSAALSPSCAARRR